MRLFRRNVTYTDWQAYEDYIKFLDMLHFQQETRLANIANSNLPGDLQ